MEYLLYFYTLAIMAVSVMSAALSLSSFYVSRHRIHLVAMAAALFYFCDSALIFLDDLMLMRSSLGYESFYSIPNPFLKTLFSTGVLVCVWLIICYYFDEKRKPFFIVPGVVFGVVSLGVGFFAPPSPVTQFVYYGLRQLFLVFITIYGLLRYRKTKSKSLKLGMQKYRPYVIFFLVMLVGIIVEDVVNILFLDYKYFDAEGVVLPYLRERNFCENILAIAFFAYTFSRAAKNLSMRYNMPPETSLNKGAVFELETKLPGFVQKHAITKREAEVLRLLLDGKDNQNIASELGVSIGTVKAHVHNLYKKANCSSRQELKEAFWSS